MKPLLHTLAILAGVLALSASGRAATLKIGDAAPALQVAKWVQGDPVPGFDSNHVYIVEFWTLRSGPCLASIPHLNEIWQKFKDKNVVVIGQDVYERDDNLVATFVKKMDAKMTYRVTLDDKSQQKDGAMVKNWITAAGLNGVPAAFVIDQRGRIVWIGQPMDLEGALLDQILAGHFDVAASAKEFEKKQQDQLQLQALADRLHQAMVDKNWDTADAAVTEIKKLLPEKAQSQADFARLQILIGRKDYPGACQLAGTLSDAQPDNAALQNDLAWNLSTAKGLDQQGLALANKIAGRANTAAKGKEPAILDTLARVQFMNGQTNEAVASEQAAVDIAPVEMKAFFKKCLTDYQQGKLPEISQQP